jgi:hypothetical protein
MGLDQPLVQPETLWKGSKRANAVGEKEVTDIKHTYNDLHTDAKVFILNLMEGFSEILLSAP